MDGVPFITQPPIKPGETFTYEFTIKEGNAGSHMYHSHHNAAEQVTKGLLGAFIVEEKDPASRPGRYRLHDGAQRWPHRRLQPQRQDIPGHRADCGQGGAEGADPVHERGSDDPPDAPARLSAAGRGPRRLALPQPYYCDTVNIAPGQRVECIVEPTSRACGLSTATSSATPKANTACSAWSPRWSSRMTRRPRPPRLAPFPGVRSLPHRPARCLWSARRSRSSRGLWRRGTRSSAGPGRTPHTSVNTAGRRPAERKEMRDGKHCGNRGTTRKTRRSEVHRPPGLPARGRRTGVDVACRRRGPADCVRSGRWHTHPGG